VLFIAKPELEIFLLYSTQFMSEKYTTVYICVYNLVKQVPENVTIFSAVDTCDTPIRRRMMNI